MKLMERVRLDAGYDPVTVKEVSGLSHVKQVLVYADRFKLRKVRSPIDDLDQYQEKK